MTKVNSHLLVLHQPVPVHHAEVTDQDHQTTGRTQNAISVDINIPPQKKNVPHGGNSALTVMTETTSKVSVKNPRCMQ